MTNSIIILPIILSVIIIFFIFTTPLEETFLGEQLENFGSVNWNDVDERNIVKNTVPIELKENQGKFCKVYAEKFSLITEHEYFVNAEKLIQELYFDNSTNTLLLPCDKLKGESSALHVWYVLEGSPKHAAKYEYFVTDVGVEPEFENKIPQD